MVARNMDFYKEKVMLAPMVRMCTLPFRLLCLEYGAQVVYCEELIDFKLLQCKRKINDVLGTVDYVDKTDGTIVFRTCPKEKERVVLQIGTCNPERAAKVATLVQHDVAAIDVNMGCPKEFSIKGGMGAALLNNVEKACAILTSMVNTVDIPITCKIRVLEEVDETVQFCKKLAATGISAIAVHGRTRRERPRHRNRNYMLKELSSQLDIPVIANGGSKEIENYEGICKFFTETGCSSVMIARAAQHNCSIFRKEGKLPLDDVIKSYLRYAVDYDNSSANTKYCIQNMLRELQDTPRGQIFLETQTLQQICDIWGLGDYCRQKQSHNLKSGLFGRWEVVPESARKKRKIEEGIENETSSSRCAFIRNLYNYDKDIPKTRLMALSREQRVRPPRYETVELDKLFTSILTYNGKKYSSSFWEKNKRCAEQGAAIVCLYRLGIYKTEELKKNGILR